MNSKGVLEITHGLPGSGKSTWAKKELSEAAPGSVLRVNSDDIRDSLFGVDYRRGNPKRDSEEKVAAVKLKLIADGLKSGKRVICDDTHLNPRFLKPILDVAKAYNAPIKQKYFNVPIEECKRRNNLRAERGEPLVPEFVIDRMAKGSYSDGELQEFLIKPDGSVFLFNRKTYQKVEDYNNTQLKKFPLNGSACISVDMDGTLADMRAASDRAFGGKKKNFDLFHRLGRDAPANEDVLSIIQKARAEGLNIIGLTGRSDNYSEETIEFLNRIGAPISKLYMRKSNDFRPDYEIKKEILQQIRDEGLLVVHAIDDNPQVLKMWREENVRTTVIPFHTPVEFDEKRVYDKIEVKSPLDSGVCIRCGQPLKHGSIGPKCRLK
jgi:predicted kinase